MEARNAKVLEPAIAGDEENCHKKKRKKLSQCWREELSQFWREKIEFDKCRGSGNNSSAASHMTSLCETRSANQTDDKALPKGFYNVEKTPADEMKENDKENHLELSSSSEPETMFEVRVMYDPSLDLQEELMCKTISEARMRKLIEDIRKVAHVLNKNTAHCRRLSEENSYLLDELKMLVNSIEISILE